MWHVSTESWGPAPPRPLWEYHAASSAWAALSLSQLPEVRYPRLPCSGIPVRRGSSARTLDPDALGRFLQTKKTGPVLVPTDLIWSLCSGADPVPVRVMALVSIRHGRPVSPAAGINDLPGLNPMLYLRFRSSCEIDDISRGWSRNRLARGGCSLSASDCLVKNRKLWFFTAELNRGLAALRFLLLYFEFPTQLPRPSECTKSGQVTVASCSELFDSE